ncbi:TPA: replication factor C large subunit [Candidatus Micrarchaeota archaeon]|nr:replication factor C large subunit [Candidatus Micrarchaeota archaeon]
MLWTLKYSPKKVEEIAGNDEAKTAIKKWALEWARGKKQRPLLVHGPSGVGKTAVTRALAEEFGWILVETGSSEVRNEKGLSKQFGEAGAEGLFGKRLLVVDDLDAVFDRGEVQTLLKLLDGASQPVVLCANDVWEPKLAPLREACTRVELKRINKTTVKAVLGRIAKEEQMGEEITPDTIASIADFCKGDLRAAIIDLQAGFSSEREQEEDVFKSLIAVFKGSFNKALESEPQDYELFLKWVEENIPIEYEKPEDVAEAFKWFSKANVFRGRIYKRQDYGLMLYERALALGGVAAAKSQPYSKFSRYQFPAVIKMLSRSKAERQALKKISLDAAQKLHCSSKEALQTLLAMPEKTWEAMGFCKEEQAILAGART